MRESRRKANLPAPEEQMIFKKIVVLSSIVFFLSFIFFLFLHPIANNDIWFHLKIGEAIFQTKKAPLNDYYSFTAYGAKYLDQEWLSQLILFLVYSKTGFLGLQILHSSLICLAFLFLFLTAKEKNHFKFLVFLILIPLALAHDEIRPHMFTWFFASLFIFLVYKKLWPVLPVLFLIWANMHGGFLFALIALFFYSLIDYSKTKNKKTLIFSFLSFLTPLLNPYGLHIYFYPLVIGKYTKIVGEWQPFKTDSVFFWIYFAYVLFLLFLFLKNKNYRQYKLEAVFFIFAAIFGFSSMRQPIMMGILTLPIFLKLVPEKISEKNKLRYLFLSLILLLIFALPLSRYKESGNISIDKTQLPIYASKFIKDKGLKGNMLNDYNFGGYFIWEIPENKVFVDGRLEVYQGKPLDDYLIFSTAKQGWEKVLDDYKIDFIVLRPERTVNEKLLLNPNWEIVYFDFNSVIYVKKNLFPSLRRLTNVTPWKHRDRNKIDVSISELNYLLTINPDFYGAHKLLAFLYLRKNQPDLAKEHLNIFLRFFPAGKNAKDVIEIKKTLKMP